MPFSSGVWFSDASWFWRINGLHYDLTDFADLHPGGPEAISAQSWNASEETARRRSTPTTWTPSVRCASSSCSGSSGTTTRSCPPASLFTIGCACACGRRWGRREKARRPPAWPASRGLQGYAVSLCARPEWEVRARRAHGRLRHMAGLLRPQLRASAQVPPVVEGSRPDRPLVARLDARARPAAHVHEHRTRQPLRRHRALSHRRSVCEAGAAAAARSSSHPSSPPSAYSATCASRWAEIVRGENGSPSARFGCRCRRPPSSGRTVS